MKNKKQYSVMVRTRRRPHADIDCHWKTWATTTGFAVRQEGPAVILTNGYHWWATCVVGITDAFTYYGGLDEALKTSVNNEE
jgi:hypothetical protein